MWKVYSEWGEIRLGVVMPMGGEVVYRGYDRLSAKAAFAREVARLEEEGYTHDPEGVLDEEVEAEAVAWLRKGDELALVLLAEEEEE